MYERHADPVDAANELAGVIAEEGIAAARRAAQPETHPEFDGRSCVDCGGDIPVARLAMGKVRCVTCQSVLEHKRKLHSKSARG